MRNLIGRKAIYRTPDGRRAATYARFAQRGAATVTDLGVCFWVPYVILGAVTSYVSHSSQTAMSERVTLPGALWLGGVALCVLGYLTFFVGRGRTLGMYIFRLRAIEAGTGRPPGYARAFVRALILFIFGVAGFILLNYTLSEPNASASTASSAGRAILISAVIVAVIGMWSHLWMIFDPRCQGAHDRIAGIAFIDKLVDIPENIELFRQPRTRATEDVESSSESLETPTHTPVHASSVATEPPSPVRDGYVNPRAPGGSRSRRQSRNRSRVK